MVEQYGTMWHSVEWCGGTVEQYGGTVWNSTVEQCGTMCGMVEQWNGMVEQCNSMVEQGNSVVEQCGTAWLKSVAQCGGTVRNGMVKQRNSVEQRGGTVWWNRVW